MSKLDDKARQEILDILDAEINRAMGIALEAIVDKAIATLDAENAQPE